MRILLVLLTLGTLAVAQDREPALRPVVRASGEATMRVRPDEAHVNVGVVTTAATAEQTGAQNAEDSEAAIAELRKVLGSEADIHTTGYSLNPDYHYQPGGGSPTITGYTANNTVEVRIDDLKMVGKVIDAVTANGANTISGIQFTLRDERQVRAEALKQAALNARANAEAIAAALGVRVIGLASAETSEVQVPRPMMAMAREQKAFATTPIEPGTIEVHAEVQVTLEVTP